eukprot:scaffold3154_cov145-Ochromonas_danica.AAC.1
MEQRNEVLEVFWQLAQEVARHIEAEELQRLAASQRLGQRAELVVRQIQSLQAVLVDLEDLQSCHFGEVGWKVSNAILRELALAHFCAVEEEQILLWQRLEKVAREVHGHDVCEALLRCEAAEEIARHFSQLPHGEVDAVEAEALHLLAAELSLLGVGLRDLSALLGEVLLLLDEEFVAQDFVFHALATALLLFLLQLQALLQPALRQESIRFVLQTLFASFLLASTFIPSPSLVSFEVQHECVHLLHGVEVDLICLEQSAKKTIAVATLREEPALALQSSLGHFSRHVGDLQPRLAEAVQRELHAVDLLLLHLCTEAERLAQESLQVVVLSTRSLQRRGGIGASLNSLVGFGIAEHFDGLSKGGEVQAFALSHSPPLSLCSAQLFLCFAHERSPLRRLRRRHRLDGTSFLVLPSLSTGRWLLERRLSQEVAGAGQVFESVEDISHDDLLSQRLQQRSSHEEVLDLFESDAPPRGHVHGLEESLGLRAQSEEVELVQRGEQRGQRGLTLRGALHRLPDAPSELAIASQRHSAKQRLAALLSRDNLRGRLAEVLQSQRLQRANPSRAARLEAHEAEDDGLVAHRLVLRKLDDDESLEGGQVDHVHQAGLVMHRPGQRAKDTLLLLLLLPLLMLMRDKKALA